MSLRWLAAGLTALVALGAWSNEAAAQTSDYSKPYDPYSNERAESPQEYAVEVRVGPYVPKVDDEFGGSAQPFEDVFGNDNRYQFGFEVDWQLLRIPYFGTLGPGVGLSYTKLTGRGLAADGSPSGQKSSLTIAPAYAVGVLRFDLLVREFEIPLGAYAKLGLGAAMWSINDGVRTATDDEGSKGRDISYGYQFALGGMFLLDFLDPGAAIQLDTDLGVNNSYWFFEWLVSDLDSGGSNMQVGVNTWVTGLTLEM
jgi:hypothetical protein